MSSAAEQTSTQAEDMRLYLVKFVDAARGLADLQREQVAVTQQFAAFPGLVGAVLRKAQASYWQQHENVQYVEPDGQVSMRWENAQESVGDLYGTAPGLQQVRAAQLQAKQIRGAGVRVALLDSGINTASQRLQIAGGVSFVADEPGYEDRQGHGTAMAGIIGLQPTADGTDTSLGIAPAARLYAVKVLNRHGSGNISAVLLGLAWALEQSIDIVTMCFGTQEHSAALEEALEIAYAHGLLLVAPTGNIGAPDGVDVPARYRPVIAVGAVDGQNRHAPFSNQGPEVELVAPGVSVSALYLQDLPLVQSGTSLAAAYVAGVAALVKSGDKALSNHALRRRLTSSATELGDRAQYGFGLVNAFAALQAEPSVALAAQAEPLVVDEPRTAYLTSAEQVHAYQLVPSQSAALEAVLEVPADCDCDLYVYDATGQLLTSGTHGVGVTERVLWNAQQGQTYFLHVFGYGEHYSESDAYTLCVHALTSVSGTAPSNRQLSPGTKIRAALTAADDVHWYSLDLQADDAIEVELSDIPREAAYELELYDATETLVATARTLSDTLKIAALEAAETGTYLIKVFANGAFDAQHPYGLHVDRYASLSGLIAENRTLRAEAGPYKLGTGGLTIASGVIFAIAPGTILNVRSSNPIRLQAGATLNLLGEPERYIVILGAQGEAGGELWSGLQREAESAQVHHSHVTIQYDAYVATPPLADFSLPVKQRTEPQFPQEATTAVTPIPPSGRPAATQRWYLQASPYNFSIWDPFTLHMQNLYFGIDVEIFAQWEGESNRLSDERYARGEVNYWEFVNARFMRDIAEAERLVQAGETAAHYRVQRLVDYLKQGQAWTAAHGLLKLSNLLKLETFYRHFQAMAVSFWLSHNTAIVYWDKRARERGIWQAEDLIEAHFINGVIIRLDFSSDMPFAVPLFGQNTPPIGLIGFLLHHGPFHYPEQYPAPAPPPAPPGTLDYAEETTFELVKTYLKFLLREGTSSVFTWWLPTPSDREISSMKQQRGLTLLSSPEDWKREILDPAWRTIEELETKYLQDDRADLQTVQRDYVSALQ